MLSFSTLTCGSPIRPRKAALDMLVDQLAHASFRQVARLGDARHLEQAPPA
jgi:hypothetical protein